MITNRQLWRSSWSPTCLIQPRSTVLLIRRTFTESLAMPSLSLSLSPTLSLSRSLRYETWIWIKHSKPCNNIPKGRGDRSGCWISSFFVRLLVSYVFFFNFQRFSFSLNVNNQRMNKCKRRLIVSFYQLVFILRSSLYNFESHHLILYRVHVVYVCVCLLFSFLMYYW